VLGHGSFQPIFDLVILARGKQPSRYFFWKSFLFIVRIADRHVLHSLSESLEFRIGMCLDHHCCPSFKADGSKPRDIWAFSEAILFLDEVMLAFDVAVES
jgi:hypothetical protein